MPGVQQTLENLVCNMCSEFIEEPGAYENYHDDCINEESWSCDSCGETFLNGHVNRSFANDTGIERHYYTYTSDEYTVCDDCVVHCNNCGSSWSHEDNASECCYDERYVQNYSYKPEFVFWQTDDTGLAVPVSGAVGSELYMGIELEMVRVAECAEMFIDRESEDVDSPNFFYFKEDGSVGYNGAELVTMPATLDAFMQKFPFETLEWARSKHHVRSFEYDSCGFHIHVSRSAFSDTHLWRFVRFQLKNPALCQMVAQRGSVNYATWLMDRDENAAIPNWVKGKDRNMRRYLAINFQNRNTIELRYFKGNILKNAIVKNVEFVHSMYEYTKNMSYAQVLNGGMSDRKYLDWLDVQPQYDTLRDYIAVNMNGGN